MTNRERADKIARLSEIAVGSPAKVIELALNEAEARGRVKGLEESAGVAEDYVMSSGDHGTEIAAAIRERIPLGGRPE